MALTTNRCKKHGIAYVEDECPECSRETYANNINATEEFFRNHGRDRIEVKHRGVVRTIMIEELYQYFRMRLVDELNPPDER